MVNETMTASQMSDALRRDAAYARWIDRMVCAIYLRVRRNSEGWVM